MASTRRPVLLRNVSLDSCVRPSGGCDATEIFRVHAECFDEEMRAVLEHHDPFGFKGLRYVRSVEESQALNDALEPFV